MRRLVALFAAVLVAGVSLVAVAEELKSGLQVGDSPDAFNVKDCTGPAQGKDPLCYRCRYGASPVVCVFARDVNDSLGVLAKKIDEAVAKNEDKKMRAFVVILTDDQAGTDSKLKDLAQKHKIDNVPLTTFANAKGPASYKINPQADVTVMMWEDSSVKANHAFAKGKFSKDAVAKIVADTSKILN